MTLEEVFREWVEHHKDIIGDKWYRHFMNEIRKIEKKRKEKGSDGKQAVSAVDEAAMALWIQNALCNFGIYFAYSIYQPDCLSEPLIPESFDQAKTRNLLLYCGLAFKKLMQNQKEEEEREDV